MPHSTVGSTVVEMAGFLPPGILGAMQLLVILWALAGEARIASVRVSVYRGLHEIRRPLQILMLDRDDRHDRPTDALNLAASACRELELELAITMGRRKLAPGVATAVVPGVATAKVSSAELISSTLERWTRSALREERVIEVVGEPKGSVVSSLAISQALDNLISNAMTHGRGVITIRATTGGRRLKIEVLDEGHRPASIQPESVTLSPLHGHGLTMARNYLGEVGGSLHVQISPRGSVATATVPVH